MTELLTALLNFVVPLFAISSMLAVGLRYSVKEIVTPLKNLRGVTLTLIVNFVLVPAVAYSIAGAVQLDRPYEIGLLLIATAAGAPFLIQLVRVSRGDVAFASGLLVLLIFATIVYMPIVVPWLVPEASVNTLVIARTLFLTMLLPLVIGHLIEATNKAWAVRMAPRMGQISSFSLVALVTLTVVVHLPSIFSIFGEGAILAAALVVATAFALGYIVASRPRRHAVGFGSGQRNIAAATVVAQSIPDPNVLVMVVVSSIVGLGILFPIARAIQRKRPPVESATQEFDTRKGKAA